MRTDLVKISCDFCDAMELVDPDEDIRDRWTHGMDGLDRCSSCRTRTTDE